jgi:hypothetical protein
MTNRDLAAPRLLLLVSDTEVGLGEAISLASGLDERVVIRGAFAGSGPGPLTGFSDVFFVTPSDQVIAALAPRYDLMPVAGTWQWYRAVPKAAAVSGGRGAAASVHSAGPGRTAQREAARGRMSS